MALGAFAPAAEATSAFSSVQLSAAVPGFRHPVYVTLLAADCDDGAAGFEAGSWPAGGAAGVWAATIDIVQITASIDANAYRM